MKVSCLIPLIKFDYVWIEATGLRFSELERMILRAIAGEGETDTVAFAANDAPNSVMPRSAGKIDAAVLSAIFRLHERILIETIINLIRLGLVNVDASELLSVTGRGNYAIKHGLPETPDFGEVNKFTVVREQLTGRILPANDIYFDTKGRLVSLKLWEKFIVLPASFDDTRVDEGLINTLVAQEVKRRVRRKHKEGSTARQDISWIHEIRPAEVPYHFGKYFIPVDVDTETKEAVGLPFSLEGTPCLPGKTFREYVIEEAEEQVAKGKVTEDFFYWKHRKVSIPKSVPDVSFETFETSLTHDDLLLDDRSHIEFLMAELEQASDDSTIAVASAFVNVSVLEKLREPLAGALQRGAKIDLIWGLQEDRSKGLKILNELRGSVSPEQPGKLSFNAEQTPSGSHIKLLVSVKKTEGKYKSSAVIGSYNWLSRQIGTDADAAKLGNVSIVLRHPHLVSQLCSVVAQLWSNANGQSETVEQRKWRRLVPELARCPLPESDFATNYCQVRIVHGDQQLLTLKHMIENAESRLAVASHRLDNAAKERVGWVKSPLLESSNPEIRFLYELLNMHADDAAEVQNKINQRRAMLIQKTPMHSKIVVADDDAMVSSFNFLSGIERENDFLLQSELGLFIKGGIAANTLWQELNYLTIET